MRKELLGDGRERKEQELEKQSELDKWAELRRDPCERAYPDYKEGFLHAIEVLSNAEILQGPEGQRFDMGVQTAIDALLRYAKIEGDK